MLDVRCLKFASVWRFCYFGMGTNLDHEENSSESGGNLATALCIFYTINVNVFAIGYNCSCGRV